MPAFAFISARRWFAAGLVGLLTFAGILPIAAQTQAARTPKTPNEIRAGLILVFADFTEWPKDTPPLADGLVIGFVKAADLKVAMAVELKKDPNSKVKLVEVSAEAEAAKCHILYFGKNDRESQQLLQTIRNQPILTVGEGRTFLGANGNQGVVAFGFQGPGNLARIIYYVDVEAMDRAKIRLKAPILNKAAPSKGERP